MTSEAVEIVTLKIRLEQAEKIITAHQDSINEMRSAHQESIKELRAYQLEFERAEAAKERKSLIWGIGVLGFIVSTLFGIIWTYRGVIFK